MEKKLETMGNIELYGVYICDCKTCFLGLGSDPPKEHGMEGDEGNAKCL